MQTSFTSRPSQFYKSSNFSAMTDLKEVNSNDDIQQSEKSDQEQREDNSDEEMTAPFEENKIPTNESGASTNTSS